MSDFFVALCKTSLQRYLRNCYLDACCLDFCTVPEQDSRWGDAEKKLLRRTKFSKVLEQKVNMKLVNMEVMQRWIAQRITSLLGFEDDIVVGTCVNYLSEEVS